MAAKQIWEVKPIATNQLESIICITVKTCSDKKNTKRCIIHNKALVIVMDLPKT